LVPQYQPPAIGVAYHLGEAASHAEVHHHPVDTVHGLGLAVSVTVGAYRQRTVLLVDPRNLVGDDRGRLVPADTDELAHAPVLRIAAARAGRPRRSLRVPVDPPEGILDAVGGIDPLLVREMERGKKAFEGGLIDDAILLELVLPQLFLGVPLVVMMRADADDLAVLDVHARYLAPLSERALTKAFQNRLVRDAGMFIRCSCRHS
jgi:hypothetical protein